MLLATPFESPTVDHREAGPVPAEYRRSGCGREHSVTGDENERSGTGVEDRAAVGSGDPGVVTGNAAPVGGKPGIVVGSDRSVIAG